MPPCLPAQRGCRQAAFGHRPLRLVRGPPGRAGVPPAGAGQRTAPASGPLRAGGAEGRGRVQGLAADCLDPRRRLPARRRTVRAGSLRKAGGGREADPVPPVHSPAPSPRTPPHTRTNKWVRHIVAQLNSIESTLDLIEPLLSPPACETVVGGRPEKHHRREIVDAIRYVVDTGCKWRPCRGHAVPQALAGCRPMRLHPRLPLRGPPPPRRMWWLSLRGELWFVLAGDALRPRDCDRRHDGSRKWPEERR